MSRNIKKGYPDPAPDEEIMDLTRQMVRITSINGTSGEKDIGIFLEEYLRKFSYYKEHPEYLIIQKLKNDPLDRRTIIAVLRGEKDNSRRTVILHGHTDTVGLEGYGRLEEYACDPDELYHHMLDIPLPPEVERDLKSGDYMFGRGSCDMKSGDAVFITLLKRYSEHPEAFSGNIVLILAPVEENLHSGIIAALPVLSDLKKKYHFEYLTAINNDFTSPLSEDDEYKTIYTGVGGKILPCFYIQGKETHVGQCFEGLDASMIAAQLVHDIQLNMDLTDTYDGETTNPPSVLKLKDLKTWYNVQTSPDSFVYFNYFIHNELIVQITSKLIDMAGNAFDDVVRRINSEGRIYSRLNNQAWNDKHYDRNIITYSELKDKAVERLASQSTIPEERIRRDIKRSLRAITAQETDKGTDKREIGIELIRYLLHVSDITEPAIVLYYAPPYCPHNTVDGDDEWIIDVLKEAAGEITEETSTLFRFRHFYPSLSDSSYLKIDDNDDSIMCLRDNFPAQDILYPIPFKEMKELDIPAVNVGCFGRDAHKWTERVNIPYTFGVLPVLEDRMIKKFLTEGDK